MTRFYMTRIYGTRLDRVLYAVRHPRRYRRYRRSIATALDLVAGAMAD